MKLPITALIGTLAPDSYADPSDRERAMQVMAEHGWVENFEALRRRPDGSEFWGVVTIVPIDFEGEDCVAGWLYDITERKRAEEAQAAQKTVLDAVFENMDQGVIMYDSNMTVTAFNEQAFHCPTMSPTAGPIRRLPPT